MSGIDAGEMPNSEGTAWAGQRVASVSRAMARAFISAGFADGTSVLQVTSAHTARSNPIHRAQLGSLIGPASPRLHQTLSGVHQKACDLETKISAKSIFAVIATMAIFLFFVGPVVLGAMATYAEQTSLDRIESGLRNPPPGR